MLKFRTCIKVIQSTKNYVIGIINLLFHYSEWLNLVRSLERNFYSLGEIYETTASKALLVDKDIDNIDTDNHQTNTQTDDSMNNVESGQESKNNSQESDIQENENKDNDAGTR